MKPQIPHPDGKPYCVAYITTDFAYFRTLEDQTAHQLAILKDLNPEGYDVGVTVEAWEMQHGHWLLAESQELKPKPQT